jgi:L-2-hydroxyglutarate oxidase LhgO
VKTDFEITVVGAGVVGLAIAARLSGLYESIVVLEKHNRFGQETSSRNSEVIHSGIYYPVGSLKALLCVRGRELLYEYCRQHEVRYNRCGKLVVATDAGEEQQLDEIVGKARANGVNDGRIIHRDEIREMEPHINARRAIHFPSSGIVDSHGLMKSLETAAINGGVTFAYGNELTGIRGIEGGYELETATAGGENFAFTSRVVINAAGLQSVRVSEMAGISNPAYRMYYWKGEYFRIGNGKNRLVKRLIYPVPEKNITGLGVHVTLDLDGGAKLGPNAIYLEDGVIDYSVDAGRGPAFHAAAARFLPFLEEGDLHPDQAGVRPKLQKPGDAFRDFVISEESGCGCRGFINLIGIESPGLTACLAIAGYVEGMIKA